MYNPQNTNQWKKVQAALADGSIYACKIAIVEANKVFLDLLKIKGIKAKDVDEALKIVKNYLSAPEKLEQTNAIYKKILSGQLENLKYAQAKDYITAYYQALLDLKDENSLKFSIYNKSYQEFKKIFKLLIKKFQFVVLSFFVFLLLVIFLADTSLGQNLTKGVVALARLLLFSFLPAVIILLAVMILIVGSIIYYAKRPKTEGKFVIEKDEDEE